MESAETKPCTYRNLAFQFNGETMHYSVICIKVVTYPFGKIYIFIPHMIYKHKFCINKEPNVNNKTINALEENVVFWKIILCLLKKTSESIKVKHIELAL